MTDVQEQEELHNFYNSNVDYGAWVSQFMKLATKAGLQGNRVLDLACGTGTATLIMAERGFAVTGLDSAEAALEYARRKAQENKLSVRLMAGDPANFSMEDQYHLITSFHGAINLLSAEKLKDMVACVREALEPNGVFVFDILGNVYAAAQEKTMIFMPNPFGFLGSYMTRTGDEVNFHHHMFMKKEGGYQLKEEKKCFFLYSPQQLKDLFAEHGLQIVRNIRRGPQRNDLVAVKN